MPQLVTHKQRHGRLIFTKIRQKEVAIGHYPTKTHSFIVLVLAILKKKKNDSVPRGRARRSG